MCVRDILLPVAGSQREWTLCEVGHLIRKVGLLSGFEVISEYPMGGRGDLNNRSKIDWVWRCPTTGEVLSAFEVEGSNVPAESLNSDIKKLSLLSCNKYIVLYRRRFVGSPKNGYTTLSEDLPRIVEILKNSGISLIAPADYKVQPSTIDDIAGRLREQGVHPPSEVCPKPPTGSKSRFGPGSVGSVG